MAFLLRVVEGPGAGQTCALDPSRAAVIGREVGVELSVPADTTLSRRHAEVVCRGGAWALRNLSQHGSLLNGEVFQDERPLAPGATFTVGAVTVVFEEAGAGGALAAGAAAKLAAGGGEPVRLDGSAAGIPFGEAIKGGIAVAKANLVPSLAVLAPTVAFSILQTVLGMLLASSIVSLLLSVVSLGVSLLTALMVANYVGGVRTFQQTGAPLAIGDLFKFDDAVGKVVVQLVIGLGCMCCAVPGFLLSFALPIYVDRPSVGIGGALKAALAWSKKNLVPVVILMILLGILSGLGGLACGVGVLFTMPAALAAHWLVYECKRAEFVAAASEAGVDLA